MRELGKHFGHFVATFTAADIDHSLGIRPLGQLLLGDRFATTERVGNCCRAAFCDREQAIAGIR